MADPVHVVIVGCGFTGTTALTQLVDRCPVRRITILESSGDFGPGFPYRPSESREYLINNTNDTMCLRPDNRRAFLQWLENHPAWSRGLDARGHMPRALYGEFLRDAVHRATDLAGRKGIEVRFAGQECTDILRLLHGVSGVSANDDSFVIEHAFGSERASFVVNATGTVDRDVRSERQPQLTRRLVQRGLLRPYELDGEPSLCAAVDMQSFRCERSKSIHAANMLLWGAGYFTSSAIVMATVVERLLRSVYGGYERQDNLPA